MHFLQKLLSRRRLLRRCVLGMAVSVGLLGMFLGINRLFENILLQSLSEMNSEFVDHVDLVSSTLFDTIESSARLMFYSTSIETLRASPAMSAQESLEGQQALDSSVQSCPYLKSVMVYNPTTDYVYTSEDGFPNTKAADFHDQSAVALVEGWEQQEWLVPVKRQVFDGFCYTFLYYSDDPADGVLILNVDTDWYEQRLLGVYAGGSCVLLNKHGHVIVSGSPLLSNEAIALWPTLAKAHADGATKDAFYFTSGSAGFLYHHMKNSSWSYLRYIKLDDLSPSLYRMRRLAYVLLTLICCVFLLGVLLMMLRFYRPLQRVRSTLERSGGIAGSDVSQQLDLLVESHREQTQTEQLQQLFAGVPAVELHFPVCLVLADCDSHAALESYMAGHGVAGALVGRCDFGCAVVFALAPGADPSERCGELFADNAPFTACCYSRPCADLAALAQSRAALNEIWRMRFLFGEQTCYSELLLESCSAKSGFDSKEALALCSALRGCQLAQARVLWNRIFQAIRHYRWADFCFAVQYVCKSLISLEAELNGPALDLYPEQVESISSIAELQNTMESAFVQIDQVASNRKEKRLASLAQQVTERIREDYADSSLSAQQLADVMGLNAAYLGRLFRESTGHSISDAINETRVAQAKLLLAQTELSAENISMQIGCNNAKYFFVLFKKLTGETPRQYRQRVRGEG